MIPTPPELTANDSDSLQDKAHYYSPSQRYSIYYILQPALLFVKLTICFIDIYVDIYYNLHIL